MTTGIAALSRSLSRSLSRWLRPVLVTAVCCGSAAGIGALLRSGVISGPLAVGHRIPSVVAAACVTLALGGVLCTWILAGVGIGWHADGWTAAAALVCLVGGVVLGWEGGAPALRSAGGVVAPLIGPVLLATIARRALRHPAPVVVTAAVVVAATSLAVYAVRDPFHDPDCWTDCSLEDVAPWPSRSASVLFVTLLVIVEVLLAAIAWVLVARVVLRRGRDAAARLDVAVAGLAALAATAFAAIGLLPGHDAAAIAVGAGCAALALLGLAIALQPAVTLRRRQRLRGLAFALGDAPPPGALEPALARALGDKDVRVAYWLPESKVFVDAAGQAVPEAADWPVALTRDDAPIAAVRVHRTDLDPAQLESLIGSTARLAIDSERLQAEIRAQLGELQASRQRIVAASDDTRRGVERTLHDVVQAELLGAMYELARARSRAEQAGESATADELGRVAEGVGGLVATIREFARGIYPAALDAAGLAAALGALADDAPVVLTVTNTLSARPPAAVERAIYLLVHDTAMAATADLSVRIEQANGEIVVTLADVAGEVPDHLADRIGAIGGRCRVLGSTLEAVLPCG